MKKTRKHIILSKFLSAFVILSCIMQFSVVPSCAEADKVEVTGTCYEFDGNTDYTISDSEEVSSQPMFGIFSIGADVTEDTSKDGIRALVVKGQDLSFYYNYSDSLLAESDVDWFLTDDISKSIDGKPLDSKVQKGMILLQISNDRKNWNDVYLECNAFDNTPIRTDAFYKATDIQLMNGCFYKLTIAYELQKKTEDKDILGQPKYEYKRYAEAYEVYIHNEEYSEETIDLNRVYYLGSKVKTADFDSYSGEETIDKSNPHYGWDIGKFFLSGHTNTVKDSDGNLVVLKNVGDEITLWFQLEQNIDALNDDPSLTVNVDDNWYDRDFETERTNSGRGVLIVKHTNYKNESETVLYTDYLGSCASVGANTKVQVFEEGDYEVSLDYEIREDKLIDKYYHYKIFFKFLIRNGNCMVYPLDISTGGELTNGALTENGFTLDLAKSRYLNIVVKKEILEEGKDGLVDDVRFNKIARDGEVFDEEGIYTITVKNLYSGADATTKTIYVGTDPVLKAYAVNPQYSIEEIKALVGMGSTIDDNGNITLGNGSSPSEDNKTGPNTDEGTPIQNSNINPAVWVAIGAVILCAIACAVFIAVKYKKKASPTDESGGEQS